MKNMKQNYRLICVDLDGTLLTDEKTVHRHDIEALKKAYGQGIEVALITGRMAAATEPTAARLGIPCILACNAGTYILKDGKCISSEYLPITAMTEIYETVKAFGIPLWIFRNREWYVTSKDRFVEYEEKLINHAAKEASAANLAQIWEKENTGPSKLLVGNEPSIIARLHSLLKSRQDADMACSSENFLEIFPKGMDKGKALRIICEKEGISTEETIAFGDQELDIPMLEAAGVAVAMGNAIEELKRKADFVTRTNNEAGVAYALERYLGK